MSWQAVTLLLGAGVLALGALALALFFQRASVEWVERYEFRTLAASLEAHLAEFRAFVAATEGKVAQLDEGVRKAQALQSTLAQSRLPHGLRGGIGP